ncbi:MAG: S49 family peptidase [Verrucomicrobiota bacterium]|nr:S49 family peptidase [Verrucomicrobiota bacterium]
MGCSCNGRESIFSSTMRALFKSFFIVVGLFIAFGICSYTYSLFSSASLIPETTTLQILPDAEGNRTITALSAPAILQLNIHGVIGEPTQGVIAEQIENILLDSREGLLEGSRVRGILIHFDTPGGTVTDSDCIYHMLKAYKEKYQIPIYAYVEGLCASGGMYIASATDKIFAGPVSTIGSIGVLSGPFFNIYDALLKIGVQAKTITRGIDKDMMNPTRPWKEGEDASLQAIMASLYDRFVDIVTTARPSLNKDKLIHEYGAQVYDSVTAQKFGYVDVAMSSRKEALLALLEEAHIPASSPYQVVELSPKGEWFRELMQNRFGFLKGEIRHSFDLGQPPLHDRFAYLYVP